MGSSKEPVTLPPETCMPTLRLATIAAFNEFAGADKRA